MVFVSAETQTTVMNKDYTGQTANCGAAGCIGKLIIIQTVLYYLNVSF